MCEKSVLNTIWHVACASELGLLMSAVCLRTDIRNKDGINKGSLSLQTWGRVSPSATTASGPGVPFLGGFIRIPIWPQPYLQATLGHRQLLPWKTNTCGILRILFCSSFGNMMNMTTYCRRPFVLLKRSDLKSSWSLIRGLITWLDKWMVPQVIFP